jgi:peptidylprolyl isomerase
MLNKRSVTLLLAVFSFFILSCTNTEEKTEISENKTNQEKEERMPLDEGLYAEMITNRGNILLELEYEKTPMTVANFAGLAEGTINNSRGDGPFYDGLKFHRVIDDFMIQGGCPLGTGTGDPGYKFPDEFDDSLKHSSPGILSMANSGPNSNGSQFFITHVETPWLDGKHTVFGRVIDGQDVVDSIKQGDILEEVRIIREGAEAEGFKTDQAAFEALVKEAERETKAEIEESRKAELDFIRDKWPDAVETDSGLRYIITKEGDGKDSPEMGTAVTTHYTGALLDGTRFDSSIDRGEPAQFKTGQVIQGWNEALMDMTRGEKRTLIIPPELGYGERGYPGVIPPSAYLVFEVELIDF